MILLFPFQTSRKKNQENIFFKTKILAKIHGHFSTVCRKKIFILLSLYWDILKKTTESEYIIVFGEYIWIWCSKETMKNSNKLF